jgi:hypothetical protein
MARVFLLADRVNAPLTMAKGKAESLTLVFINKGTVVATLTPAKCGVCGVASCVRCHFEI